LEHIAKEICYCPGHRQAEHDPQSCIEECALSTAKDSFVEEQNRQFGEAERNGCRQFNLESRKVPSNLSGSL